MVVRKWYRLMAMAANTLPLSNVSKQQAQAHVESEIHLSRGSPLHFCLVQAVSVAKRMNYTVQKSLELAVSRILSILSARCVVCLHAIVRKIKKETM